jgi:O-antigen ligase
MMSLGSSVRRKRGPARLEGPLTAGIRHAFIIAVVLLVAALIGWAMTARPLNQAALLLGLALLVISVGIAAGAGWTAFEFVAVLILLVCALVDLPRTVAAGPITLLGATTILYACAGIAFGLSHAPPPEGASRLRPLYWFVAYAVISFVWYPTTVEGFQNVAVFIMFVVLARATGGVSHLVPQVIPTFYRWFDRAMFIAIGLYIFSVTLAGFSNDLILAPRAFALFALLGVARGLSLIRFDSRDLGSRYRGVVLTIAATAAIFLSLSRTALAIAVILVPLAWLDRHSVSRRVFVLLAICTVAGLFAFAATAAGPLGERFQEADKEDVGGVTLSVSGRGDFWSAAWRSWLESPWVGHGAGSSEYLPRKFIPDRDNYAHPHNDYLRLLHDYGIVGAGLWLIGGIALLRRTKRVWRAAVRTGSPYSGVHLAAVLGMVALALAMITDNAIIYVFFMAPLAMMVGLSLGVGSPDRPSAESAGTRASPRTGSEPLTAHRR